jgi:hypothetical protein
MAKLIIKLFHWVTDVVNNYPIVGDKLKVIMYLLYSTSVRIFWVADIINNDLIVGNSCWVIMF